MQVLVAPDKFKGSLTAAQVAHAMRAGVLAAAPAATVTTRPIADGGDGFLDAIIAATAARVIEVEIQDAIGRTRIARIAIHGETGYLEAADAVGITQTDPTPETALNTDTGGVGQMILASLDAGATSITIGLGGTSSTDGGTGMLRALGAELLTEDGRHLQPGGGNLTDLHQINLDLDPRVFGCRFVAAHDVTSPLLGPSGAAAVFGPQKGADERAVHKLGAGLTHLADVLLRQHGLDIAAVPGGGAAGGLGGALGGVLRADMRSGAAVVFALTGLDEELRKSDLVLTGEGSFDEQSLDGKGPYAVLQTAQSAGVPAVVIAGRATLRSPHPRIPGDTVIEALADNFADPFVDTTGKIEELAARATGRAINGDEFAARKQRS